MSPLFFKVANAIMPPIGALLCAPAGYSHTGRRETSNKIRAIESVEFAHNFLGGHQSVKELVTRIHAAGRFQALWLSEGLGQLYANRLLEISENPRNLFTEGEGRDIPENLLLIAHAGMALAFARYHLDRLKKSPAANQARETARRIAGLIEANALKGYSGISYEAWGMVTRFFYGKHFMGIVEGMQEFDPKHVPHLWHGAGRAVYFFAFMPGWKEPWPVFRRIDREANGRTARLNLLAGLGSANIIVNMQTPEILEIFVRERLAKLEPEEIAAYSQGLACSMVLRQDTTPDEEHVLALFEHVPRLLPPEMWERVIAGPARLAIHTLHPKLKAEGRLDDMTFYHPIEESLGRKQESGA